MKTFELTPLHRKSFYGKCAVTETPEGHKYLDSYGTRVASISSLGALTFTRDASHLSNTTLRHISAFLDHYGYPTMTKKQILAY